MKPVFEQVDLGKNKSILAFNYAQEHFDAPWHFHPQYELTYIWESVGTKFIGDYVGAYEPGELVLLSSNLPHCWKNHAGQIAPSRSTVIQWNAGIFARAPELNPLRKMLQSSSRGILFDAADVLLYSESMERLTTLKGQNLYVQLLSLLVQLSQCRYQTLSEADFKDDLPAEYTSRMAKIHDFVRVSYQRKIYLREPAALVNMTEQSFSRFFSKVMGRPFFRFLNEYRISMAERMLIDTDWPIAQIGFACGYESLPFFHKQFNKFNTVSPSRYRKKHGLHQKNSMHEINK